MANPTNDKQDANKGGELTSFMLKRVVIAIILIIVVLWTLAIGLGYLESPGSLIARSDPAKQRSLTARHDTEKSQSASQTSHTDTSTANKPTAEPGDRQPDSQIPDASAHPGAPKPPAKTAAHESAPDQPHHQQAAGHDVKTDQKEVAKTVGGPKEPLPPPRTDSHPPERTEPGRTHAPSAEPTHAPAAEPTHVPRPTGVAFVEAAIQPIEHELKHRFWGWRPNDIINVTDNINSFQLGVLEVTRRTAVQLAERISRTGSTDAFDRNLENAMNWLMVKSDRYWFPSPESKYKESLKELEAYKDKLISGKASFYTRTDNLIPLLAAYEDLLGSCDENLVKPKENDGSMVSFFKTDDYFYYAKGITKAMATILEAVHHDFGATIENRHASELLHHAIVSCRRAASLDPWIITNGDLDGILANHRANMAAPVSHARFYLSQMIKTLST